MINLNTETDLIEACSKYLKASIRQRELMRETASKQMNNHVNEKRLLSFHGRDTRNIDAVLVNIASFLAFTERDNAKQINYLIKMQEYVSKINNS